MSTNSLDPHVIDYVITTIIGILAFISITISIMLLKSVYCSSKTAEQIKTYSHYCSILTVCFYSLVGICTVIAFINILLTYHDTQSGLSYQLTRAAIFCWELGMFFLLCTFSYRVRSSFCDSFLALSPILNKTIYSLCILIFILGIGIIVFIMLKWYIIRDIFAGLTALLFTVLSIALMTIFIRRIDKIMFAKYEQCGTNNSVIKSNKHIVEFRIDTELVNLIVRHAVVVSISIASAFIAVVLSIVIPKFNNDGRYPMFSYLIIVLSVCIDTLSIYLSFSFAEKTYIKLCSKMHVCCKKCKINQMAKRYSLNEKQLSALRQSVLLEIQLKHSTGYVEMQDDYS
eukprot:276721_1